MQLPKQPTGTITVVVLVVVDVELVVVSLCDTVSAMFSKVVFSVILVLKNDVVEEVLVVVLDVVLDDVLEIEFAVAKP